MDHLPHPTNSARKVRVPYYGGKYDGGPFSSYLERQGTNIQELFTSAISFWTPDEAIADICLDQNLVELAKWLNDIQVENDSDKALIREAELLIDDVVNINLDRSNADYSVRRIIERMRATTQHEFDRGRLLQSFDCQWKMRRLLRVCRLTAGRITLEKGSVGAGETILRSLRRRPLSETFRLIDEVENDSEDANLARILQNWLFFGLLHDVFTNVGIGFNENDFIQKDKFGSWLTTSALGRYILEWKKQDAPSKDYESSETTNKQSQKHVNEEMHSDERKRQERGMRVISSLHWATKVAYSFEMASPNNRISESSLMLAVLIVSETLQKEASKLYGRGSVMSHSSSFLRSKFLQDGWCPDQVSAIESNFLLPFQYYIYLLGSGYATKDFHRDCTASHCEANQITDASYHISHALRDDGTELAEPCSMCHVANQYFPEDSSDFFGSLGGEVTNIVETGGIPLISIWNANLENFNNDPKIVRYVPGQMEYVALSHVWADGLGNPSSNSIRHCQTMSLAKSLTMLGPYGTIVSEQSDEWELDDGRMSDSSDDDLGDGRLYFWLDTVCVPLAPFSARQTAIQSMSGVFSKAKATLVMTHDLRKINLPPTALETIARILTSNWTRRLWTYSEAMQSEHLAFKFSGEWVWLSEVLENLEEDASQDDSLNYLGGLEGLRESINSPWTFQGTINDIGKSNSQLSRSFETNASGCISKIQHLAEQLRAGRKTEEHRAAQKFLLTIGGMPWRATSHRIDEIICVAQLLGFDVNLITEESGDFHRAFKLLLRMQHAFPKEFAFVKASRMTEEGFRWAPRSFLGNCLDQRDIERVVVRPTLSLLSSEGLVLTCSGIVLASAQAIPLEFKRCCRIDMSLDVHSTADTMTIENDIKHLLELCIETRGLDQSQVRDYAQKSLAIIVNVQQGLPILEQTVVDGILVDITKQEGGIIYSCFLSNVSLKRLELTQEEESYWTANLNNKYYEVLKPSRILNASQGWCLH